MIHLVRLARSVAVATALVGAALVSACSSGTVVGDTGTVTGSGGSTTTTSSGGPVPCGAEGCAADEYCFKPWDCLGIPCGAPCGTNSACTGSCACTCGPLPDSCPETSPCYCPAGPGNTGFSGYYGSPGETFDGGTPYPDHQVACYGS
jgi:hypothetical protein